MNNQIPSAYPVLGKNIKVISEQVSGSFHLKNSEHIYTVTSAEAENICGEILVLGKGESADSTALTVIAVMHNKKTDKDALIAVRDNYLGTELCYECNLKAVFGAEYDFADDLYEKTCGAVMFTEKDGERRYLLIENDSGHIGFPKGHVENGETENETAVREVKEETALTAEPMDGFRMSYSYINASGHRKTAVYFLSHYDYTAAVIQQEELTNSWLLPYNEAIKMLNYPQDIPVLENAEKFLNKA